MIFAKVILAFCVCMITQLAGDVPKTLCRDYALACHNWLISVLVVCLFQKIVLIVTVAKDVYLIVDIIHWVILFFS